MTHPNHIEVREQRWHAYRQDLDMAGDCAFAPLDPAPHRCNYVPTPRQSAWVIALYVAGAIAVIAFPAAAVLGYFGVLR